MNLPAWSKKLPRSVTVTGVKYKITFHMDHSGACFNCTLCTIKLGCTGTRDIAMQALIHEISEVVHVHHMNRFHSGSENGDLVFVMDHDAFEKHNYAFHAAMVDCGLLK